MQTNELEQRRCARAALCLAIAQLLLGLLAGSFHELGGFGVEGDFYAGYAPAARSMARGEWVELPRSGPGYSALLALCSFATDDLFLIAKIISALSVAAAGWFSYRAIASFVAARTALFVQLLLYVVLFRYAFTAGNDVLFVALSTCSLFFLLKSARPSTTELALAGISAGVATITRYPGLSLVVAAVAGLALWHPAQTAAIRRLRNASVFVLGAALSSSPWWISNLVRYGHPLHNQGHALIALDAYGDPSQRLSSAALAQMEARYSSLADIVREDPLRFAAHVALDSWQDAQQMLADLVPLPAHLFLGAGLLLLFLPGRCDRRRAALFCLHGLLGFACVALVPYQERYGYAILPVLLLPIAFALLHPLAEARAEELEQSLRALRALAVASVLAVLAAVSALKTHKYLTSEPLELFSAARVLRAQPDAGRIVARKPHLGYLSGRGHLAPQSAPDLEHFVDWLASQSDVRYLYVGSAEVEAQPVLAPLARAEVSLPRLHLLDRSQAPPACLYRIE